MKQIDFGAIKIEASELASQGNAILGIRDSGKSYTATYMAERLLEAGVPFVAFDPIGIWKYLRVSGKGSGYPVVVAGGGSGDLPLTPQSAPEIVRAAMRENIPLVLDLYSIQLSKQDWKRIVEQSVRLLLYENGNYGLRHIFIEEAAEFAPQRVGADQGAVYAEIEKLARMGGNALLGYTLINQRAEEVNKAVLELCDCLFLHRQKGRNSLTALSKWLDIGDVSETKTIIQSLPRLGQGECWVGPAGSDEPVKVKIPEKQSFHPNRRILHQKAVQGQGYKAVDVSRFVEQMSGTLERHIVEAKQNDPHELRKRIAELERELQKKQAPAKVEKVLERVEVPVIGVEVVQRLEEAVRQLVEVAKGPLAEVVRELGVSIELAGKINLPQMQNGLPKGVQQQLSAAPVTNRQSGQVMAARRERTPVSQTVEVQLRAGERKMLETLGRRYPLKMTRAQLGTLAGFTPSGGTFGTYFGTLKRAGFLEENGGEVQATQAGLDYLGHDIPSVPASTEEVLEMWRRALRAGERKMLDEAVAVYPETLSREELGSRTGFTPSGGTFGTYLGTLRRNGLLEIEGDQVRASKALFL